MELFFLALLFFLMAFALASGYPVAFALPGAAILSILLAAFAGWLFEGNADEYFVQGGWEEWLAAGVINFRGVYWEVERDTLIAIPLFVFMGIMLQRSKIAEDLLVTMAQLFGPVPGGLGISVVFVGALLAATTGILGATVVAMGLISLPAMMRNNYSNALASGTIAASGTLGQIIPPSIVLIILADQLSNAVDQAETARKALHKESTGQFSMPSEFSVSSTSAGDMFLGALVPGLILVGLYMLFILVVALVRPKMAPAVRVEGKWDFAFWRNVVLALVPPLTLILAVLGSIILGVATVNQAGAIGAVGAMIMAGYRLMEGQRGAFYPAIIAGVSLVAIAIITSNYELNVKNIRTADDQFGVTMAVIAVAFFLLAVIWSGWRTFRIDNTLRGVMIDTAKTTSLVFIILLGAAMLTAAFRAFGGEELVREFLQTLPGGFWAQFIIVMAVIFLLGFFLDFIEIAVVVVPIVAPILLMDPSANITAVWLGVMIGLNIQTSFLTPPFGFALFYLRGVAPAALKTVQIYKGVVPFIILQLVALGIVGSYPPLVNYLPLRLSLTADTAPPPLNPKLQPCIEEYVFAEYAARGDTIRQAIARAQEQDLSYLPSNVRSDLQGAFKKAGATFGMLQAIAATEKDLKAAVPAYRPLHREVRALERRRRLLKKEIDLLSTTMRRLEVNQTARRDELQTEIAHLEDQRQALLKEIPAGWKDANAAFAKVRKADMDARRAYRRNVDAAYEPIRETIAVIGSAPALIALKTEVAGLRKALEELDRKAARKAVKDVVRKLNRVKGARRIGSSLNRVARTLRRRTPNMEKAQSQLAKAIERFDQDVAWRQRARTDLLPGLQTYEAAIRDTIGLRLQPKIPREQALFIAGCNANHRDISLNF
ncbi:MAG: TRAP transporter large permease subunit [Pseudomonadota bacterium]